MGLFKLSLRGQVTWFHFHDLIVLLGSPFWIFIFTMFAVTMLFFLTDNIVDLPALLLHKQYTNQVSLLQLCNMTLQLLLKVDLDLMWSNSQMTNNVLELNCVNIHNKSNENNICLFTFISKDSRRGEIWDLQLKINLWFVKNENCIF